MEGGRGGGRWSMTLYPHCIPTVSSLYLSKERRAALLAAAAAATAAARLSLERYSEDTVGIQ